MTSTDEGAEPAGDLNHSEFLVRQKRWKSAHLNGIETWSLRDLSKLVDLMILSSIARQTEIPSIAMDRISNLVCRGRSGELAVTQQSIRSKDFLGIVHLPLLDSSVLSNFFATQSRHLFRLILCPRLEKRRRHV